MFGRATLGAAAALTAVLAWAAPAAALPEPTIPPDVTDFYTDEAADWAAALGAGLDSDFSDVRVGAVHEVFWFSKAFVDGEPTDEPVRPSGTWLGVLQRGDQVLGTLGVWKPDGGRAEPFGLENGVPIATAMGTLAPTELLVQDEPTGAYYALSGTAARPLNDWAREYLSEPGDVAALQDVVAARYAELANQPAEPVDPPMLPFALGAMAVTLAAGIGVVLARRRPRQTTG
ncbi:hypothetical protein [Blastococcus sp. PRF04-17]|uniref:hypothetical protein n=1 Tax=Blastococcus sp. PRF04-17 TaxID=2933797 RepID=UPI001FF34A23|nr:hypothetical protein [Blastococcus sp. PRF04-17]UOY00432.1 hypothetical protein MVA48_15690 [Blastococcus sp. PRF04-17]